MLGDLTRLLIAVVNDGGCVPLVDPPIDGMLDIKHGEVLGPRYGDIIWCALMLEHQPSSYLCMRCGRDCIL